MRTFQREEADVCLQQLQPDFCSPLSSRSCGRKTNRRCCSVSSWWRIKACTAEPPTWTSSATSTERSGSCSPNPAPATPPLSWEKPNAQISQVQSLQGPEMWRPQSRAAFPTQYELQITACPSAEDSRWTDTSRTDARVWWTGEAGTRSGPSNTNISSGSWFRCRFSVETRGCLWPILKMLNMTFSHENCKMYEVASLSFFFIKIDFTVFKQM